VELHHLPTGSVAAWRHTPATLERQLGRAEAIAAECAQADERYAAGADPDAAFPARTGPGCGWCDFRAACPAGQAASRRRDPWDGLDEEAVSAEAPAGVPAG
jgi:hypothetical protein